MNTQVELVLLFWALPVMALPPKVLSDTEALPVDEDWKLLVQTDTVLVFRTLEEKLKDDRIVLCEWGPVLLMEVAPAEPTLRAMIVAAVAAVLRITFFIKYLFLCIFAFG